MCLMTETDSPTKTIQATRLSQFELVSADGLWDQAHPIISTKGSALLLIIHAASLIFHVLMNVSVQKQMCSIMIVINLSATSNDLVHLVLHTQVQDSSVNLG